MDKPPKRRHHCKKRLGGMKARGSGLRTSLGTRLVQQMRREYGNETGIGCASQVGLSSGLTQSEMALELVESF